MASNNNCVVKNKTPAERKGIAAILKSMKIDYELVLGQECGTWNLFRIFVVD